MKRHLLTLQNIQDLGNDYVLFQFTMPDDLEFQEGQYGVFLHVDKEIEGRRMRAFSFASFSQSKTLDIATKITENPSSFKQAMKQLQVGDQMTVDGPMGNFVYHKDRPAVWIAGGIGITPIRSILQQVDQNDNVLIYSERNNHFPFQDEFNALQKTTIFYVSGVEETTEKILQTVSTYQNTAQYYIAGSPSFITSIQTLLQEHNISSDHIVFDRFTGYTESEM